MQVKSLHELPRSYLISEDHVFPWEYPITDHWPSKKESYQLWRRWIKTPQALIWIMHDPKLGNWKTQYGTSTGVSHWDFRKWRMANGMPSLKINLDDWQNNR
mgnify:FL=1